MSQAKAEESDEELEFFIPKAYCAKISESIASWESREHGDTMPPLLEQLQRNGHLQELTIIERRRSSDEHVEHLTSNGKDTPKKAEPPKSDETHNEEPSDLRVRKISRDLPPLSNVALNELENSTDEINLPNDSFNRTSKNDSTVTKHRTHKNTAPNDPAKALTEMSVRGLDLFRYASVDGGLYQCLECAKHGSEKRFKNKYSFQRHAFLYHEGKQRKVFPCTTCDKAFSRPDKLKNHVRLMHQTTANEAKAETSLFNAGLCLQFAVPQDLQPTQQQQEQQHHFQQLLEQHQTRQQQQQLSSVQQQLLEQQRRRQHEQNVMRIRSVVNAINLRQLQQMQRNTKSPPQPTLVDLRKPSPSTGQANQQNRLSEKASEQTLCVEKPKAHSIVVLQNNVLNGNIGSQ